MFSTPLISCSSGVETVSASVRASAPGYIADTTTVGGMTSGYCAMGKATMDSIPASMMTMAPARTASCWGIIMISPNSIGSGDVIGGKDR